MIPALVPSLVHHAIASKPPQTTTTTTTTPTSGGASSGQSGTGSIAQDVGKLTTDVLSLLGVGDQTVGSSGQKGAQAYATASDLGR